MRIDQQSEQSASPTTAAHHHSGEEMDMGTAEKITLSKYALVAVAEARLAARKQRGDAAQAHPSALQQERIDWAVHCTRLDAAQALTEFEAHPLGILLYGSDGGFPVQELLHEMQEGVAATI